jgi:hypothetical protein
MPAMTARARWLIGGGVAGVAVIIAVAAALILSSRSVPEALKYVPGNSVVVAELRLDLPGDQLQKVGNVLAHFPGFKDQSILPSKIDEALDRLVKDVSNGSTDYSTNLQPWLAGPTFVGVLPTSSGPGASPSPASASPASDLGDLLPAGSLDGVVVATTDGKVTCDAAISGGSTRSIPQGSMLVGADGEMACFMDGKFGLLGTPAGVEAALAAHAGGTGVDREPAYNKARDTLGGDRLATIYVSGSAAGLMQAAGASPPISLPISIPGTASLPEWLIAGVRAEDDALVSDVFVAPSKPNVAASAGPTLAGSPLPTFPPPHPSAIAGFLPGNTLALAELHGVGVSAQTALAALRSDPQFQAAAAQLDAALGLAGGPEGVVGWVSDAGIVAIPSNATAAAGVVPGLDLGVVLVATDEATATAKAAQLKSLLSLAAFSGGGSVNDVNVGGTTVTTIDLGSLSGLLGSSGAAGDLGGVTIPEDLHITLSLAVRGKLVLLGGDDAFPRDVLQVDAGATLADQDAYKRSLDRASASNLAQVYVAGDPLRALIARLAPTEPDLAARWQTEFLPYAQPIDAILLTTTLENGLSHTRVVVTVSTPTATPSATP